jgi:AcrR family transcriptional regulator
VVPKLWNETIAEHRKAVHEAILDTTASLVAEHGLTSVTMSQIAQATGIGRATLYKYFPDVEAIMMAWHERQVTDHLHQLAAIREQIADPGQRLHAVLQAYAMIRHQHHDQELASLLHRGPHMDHARRHLRDFVAGLIARATPAGQVRGDVASGELAEYCLHALSAAADLPSKAAVSRLVTVTMAGLRPEQ